jgi:hypothetical protein
VATGLVKAGHYHKPKEDRWLARHKNIFTSPRPTPRGSIRSRSGSILSSRALAGASFTSPRQLRGQDAHPFEWTKQVVFSKHPRTMYASLCN